MTAVVVVGLVAEGRLGLDTRARALLGGDLLDIDDRVTVEHLLRHRSGIGDYLDEDVLDDVDEPGLAVPVDRLVSTASFLPALTGFPQKFPPGEDFSYCNGGYVVLALLAERASGEAYHDLVRSRVLQPAGMTASGFFRMDDLPPDTALGYLKDGRTNAHVLPVLANGDGGMFTTATDMTRFWAALFAGRIVPRAWLARMLECRPGKDGVAYGLGLKDDGTWIHVNGYDAGVAFVSAHHPGTGLTWSVLANTADESAPVIRHLDEVLSAGLQDPVRQAPQEAGSP